MLAQQVEEREHLIEWLTLMSGYSRTYWESKSDDELKLNYKNYWRDQNQ